MPLSNINHLSEGTQRKWIAEIGTARDTSELFVAHVLNISKYYFNDFV